MIAMRRKGRLVSCVSKTLPAAVSQCFGTCILSKRLQHLSNSSPESITRKILECMFAFWKNVLCRMSAMELGLRGPSICDRSTGAYGGALSGVKTRFIQNTSSTLTCSTSTMGSSTKQNYQRSQRSAKSTPCHTAGLAVRSARQ